MLTKIKPAHCQYKRTINIWQTIISGADGNAVCFSATGCSAVIIVITICIITTVALSTWGGKAALLSLSKRLNASRVWSTQSSISGRLSIRISTCILIIWTPQKQNVAALTNHPRRCGKNVEWILHKNAFLPIHGKRVYWEEMTCNFRKKKSPSKLGTFLNVKYLLLKWRGSELALNVWQCLNIPINNMK